MTKNLHKVGHPIIGHNPNFRGVYPREDFEAGVYPKAESYDYWFINPPAPMGMHYLICEKTTEGLKDAFRDFVLEDQLQAQCPHCSKPITLS